MGICQNCKYSSGKCKYFPPQSPLQCVYKELSDEMKNCNHNFEENQVVTTGALSGCTISEEIVLVCKKCGYEKTADVRYANMED